MQVNLKGSLRSFLHSILDFIYPPLCLSCERLLNRGQEYICRDCWNSITSASRESDLFKESERKLISSGVIDALISLYVFEKKGVFQVIVHNLKYSGVKPLGLELGRRLGRALDENGIRADAIVPVPLHRRKQRERGYNQAELIAQGIAEMLKMPVRSDFVRRRRYTKTQTVLTLEERHKNMEDAFEVPLKMKRELKGKTFVVVDDVVTTGSTMISCGRVLRASGAGVVIGASAALAE